MKPRHLSAILILFPFQLIASLAAQTVTPPDQGGFFGLDKILDVRIVIDADGWRSMFPRGRPPSGVQRTTFPYAKARVGIADYPEQEVGLRFKGNSTFWMTGGTLKRSFKIDFDRFHQRQAFLGLKKLSLNNNAMDGTQLRESVSYKAYRDSGVPAARTAFARVFLTITGEVDDEYLGFYTIIEQVDRRFLKRTLGQKGALVKPTWQVMEYYGDTWNADYERGYVPKTKVEPEQMQPLVELAGLIRDHRSGWSRARVVTEEQEREIQARFAVRIERVLDVDAFLHYVAVTTLIGNQDSPFVFPHNYYLVIPDETKKVLWLPWDLNNSLGGLGFLGGRNVHQQSILKPTTQPIIARVLEVPQFRERYEKIVKKLIHGPCGAKQMLVNIELADRTSKEAIAREATRSEVVVRAGRLGGGTGSGRPNRLGFGLGRGPADLAKFVRLREKSVLDQLAGRSEGIAARPSLLDGLFRGPSRRRR